MNESGIRAVDEELERLVSTAESSLRVLTDDVAVIKALVDSYEAAEKEGQTAELLCTQESLKQLEKAFVSGTQASQLAAENLVAFRSRTGTGPDLPTLVFDGASVMALLPVGGNEVSTLPIEAEDTRDRLDALYRSMWEAGLPFSFDLPPYPTMLSLAEQQLGAEVRADIESATAVLQQRDGGASVRPVALAVVIGARHQSFVADISEWAETTGLATQATVSNVKTDLEELGVVTTDSVPHGVGRPRQRLRFADESFESLPIEELVATVQSAY